jgi:hypothetical protein
MTPERHSRSETVKSALLWVLGVFALILLMLLILVFSGWR